MGKKAFAVTGVMHDGEFTEPGAELDLGKFSKEQLQSLHDAGAVEIRETPGPDTSMIPPKVESKEDSTKK